MKQKMIIPVLFCCMCCVRCIFGARLPACVNGRLTINETLSSSDILCDQIVPTKDMSWAFRLPDNSKSDLGFCPANGSCQPSKPLDFNLSRSTQGSTLTIAQPQYSKIGSFSISCSAGGEPVPATCDLNIVCPSDVTCKASFNSGSWTLSLSCDVTKTYSSRDTYWCTAYSGTTQNNQSTMIDNQTYTPTAHSQTPYRQGTCSFSVNNLGGVTSIPSDSPLYFKVDIYPGPTSAVNAISIVRPVSPTITCPALVENVPFTCTCTTSTIGHPPGCLRWSGPASVSTTGNYGVSSLPTPSLTLTRQDHGVTRLTCEVMWAEGTYSQFYTANVSYKAENLRLMINSAVQPNVTVDENETVTLTCQADARPVATVVLEKEGVVQNTSQSPLVHMVNRARCENTGRYGCSASNTYGQSNNESQLLFVSCRPRSETTELKELNFQNMSTQTSFMVTAYPVPSNFAFTYTGTNGTDPPRDTMNVDLSAICIPESGLITFTCTITVSNVTSPSAQGHYVVTVGNKAGQQNYTFHLLFNGPTSPAANNDEQSGGINAAAVGGGIGGAVAVLIVVIVIVVIVLRRKNDSGNHNPVNTPDQPLFFTPCAIQNAGDHHYETLKQVNHVPHSSHAQHNNLQKSKPTDKAKTKKKHKGAKEDDALHVYGNMPLTGQKMKQQSPQESAAAKPKKEDHTAESCGKPENTINIYSQLEASDMGQNSTYSQLGEGAADDRLCAMGNIVPWHK